MLTIYIDEKTVECSEGATILEAADSAGIYIPRLCYHPDLPPAKEVSYAKRVFQGDSIINGEKSDVKAGDEAHCDLCLVEINNNVEPVRACTTIVDDGLIVHTNKPNVISHRKQALSKILAHHPHSCLTCAQKEGCSRTQCSANVPVDERCCILLGNCELEKVSDYIGIPGDTSKYVPRNLPIIKNDPLFNRDFNLCISCLRCVRICQNVRGVNVLGAAWNNDQLWVGTLNGAGLKEADCRFCGACVEVCPTGALLDKEDVPGVRKDTLLPCIDNCPAGIDIPRYLHFIAEERYADALNLIRTRVPFPGVLGYVCFHPCENNCRRQYIDQSVAICSLKRFVADNTPIEDIILPQKRPDSGKRIAVIGSGPTGLTASYYLQLAGHQVELFDNAEKPGGMLSHGIPDYRLPQEVFERELETLKNLGIGFNMNRRIGQDYGISELKAEGFDAILIAAGTPDSKMLNIENSQLKGILPGLEFLKSAKISRTPGLNGRVVVIGGGNVAIDAAMTALRSGAKNVQLVCLESRDEMPAHNWEIKQAEEEKIEILPSWGPKRFIANDGHVSGIELKRCTRVFDEKGRFDPRYDENDIKTLPADFVIVTIGQGVDQGLFDHLNSFRAEPESPLKADKNFKIGIEGVFAAGDIIRGPSSVIEAIADGRLAAEAVDKYLGGSGLNDIIPDLAEADNPELDSSSESIKRPRQEIKTADPGSRIKGYEVIEQTYDYQAAKMEAQRCLQCHLRQSITSVILPPELWLAFDNKAIETVPEAEGVFQLLNSEKKVLRISGTANLRQSLIDCLNEPGETKFFTWEEYPMYTKRESELIQQYLQKHGELPGGAGDDLDDLF